MSHGLKSGTLLRHDTYRVERVLGQGGFGITYLATDLSLDRLVAIKEFFPKDYCDRDGDTSTNVTLGTSSTADIVNKLKAKFIKEAKNIAKLDHPGIIKIHSAFEENNTAYYVMDYIEGESLSQIVKEHGTFPYSKAITIINGVGVALEYIHRHHINHLDIKPANIMLRRVDSRPILIDFGLSKQYDSEGNQTSTSPAGISHGYAPLEQYKAGGVAEFSPQTDIYSLSATLFYILTGIQPPHASDLVEEPLKFPDSFNSSIEPVILRGMASSRRMRPETVKHFLDDLNRRFEDSQNTQVIVPRLPVEAVELEPPTPESNRIHEPAQVKEPEPKSEPKPVPKSEPKPVPVPIEEPEPEPEPEPKPELKPESVQKSEPSPTDESGSPGEEESPAKTEASLQSYPYYEDVSRQNPDYTQFGTESEGRKSRTVIYTIIGVVACAIVIIGLFIFIKLEPSDTNQSMKDTAYVENPADDRYVTDAAVTTALGVARYTGEVDDAGYPHGEGKATFISGDAGEYNGRWNHGKMEGQASYMLKNGDTFVGTFKNDEYSEGRYTIKDTGEYYEGTYKNRAPHKGAWYDKMGKRLQDVNH